MKQVTGSNTPQTIDKVSIQLALDGHSFSSPQLSTPFPGEDPVEVELLTARTLLVPEEFFEAQRAAELLAAAGLAPAPDEGVVCSSPQNGVIAVMAANREALRTVEAALGDRARFATPLLTVPNRTDAVVWLRHLAGLLYIKVYKDTLQFAEVIPAPDEADIRYFLERLGREFPLSQFRLTIVSENPKPLRKLISRLFKQVICENPN